MCMKRNGTWLPKGRTQKVLETPKVNGVCGVCVISVKTKEEGWEFIQEYQGAENKPCTKCSTPTQDKSPGVMVKQPPTSLKSTVVPIMLGWLNELDGHSSQPKLKEWCLKARLWMKHAYVRAWCLTQNISPTHKFQVHLCEQLVDVASYLHRVECMINDAAEQNSQLAHALESLSSAKIEQNLWGHLTPADHQWKYPK